MIRKTEGRWSLSPAWFFCCERRRGTYKYDPSKMLLQDGDGDTVARIVLRHIADEPLDRPAGNVRLPVIAVKSSEIICEIQNPENAGAYFVLPSQLNGAEYPDYGNQDVVYSISSYKWDNTGGPRGQLAVHPAVGQFLLDNAARKYEESGVNAVAEVLEALQKEDCQGFELQNGYLRVPRLEGQEAVATSNALERNLWRLFTIAACEVPASGLSTALSSWSGAGHRVNLVYASAVPVGTYNNARGRQYEAFQQKVSSLLLRGAYFGAIRLALESHRSAEKTPRTKVYLMPLGGGVFNNARAEIARSVSEAVELADAMCKPGELAERLELHMLTFCEQPREGKEFASLLRARGKLRSG
mmetsp:Transcript_89232/g.168109  ORF Transcript_89232/g.168109 Transcript_89232/m.168109 type:complete len:357 (+) Transcript_89232:22-1092(+)